MNSILLKILKTVCYNLADVILFKIPIAAIEILRLK